MELTKEDLALEVGIPWTLVDHVRGSVRNREVQEPVGRSGHRQALRADLEREHLASHNPRYWSPRRGEEEYVDAHESDLQEKSAKMKDLEFSPRTYRSLLGCLVVGSGNGANDSDDELANSHTDSSHKEQIAAAHLLDKVETRESGRNVDAANDMSTQTLEVIAKSLKLWPSWAVPARPFHFCHESAGAGETYFVMTEITNGLSNPAFRKYCVP